MISKCVYIVLMPDRLDVIVQQGRRFVHAQRSPVDLPLDASEWCRAVRRLGPVLKPMVKGLSPRLPVCVLYHSPSQVSDLSSQPIASAQQAAAAAKLGCLDAFADPGVMVVTEAVVCGRDGRAVARAMAEEKAGQSSQHGMQTGGARHTHVVVAADRQDAVEAVFSMVESAGLNCQCAVPMEAAVKCRLARRCLRRRTHGAEFYVGERRAFLFVGDGGTIRFARSINFGIEPLRESLQRPIRTAPAGRPESGDEITLSREEASRLLHQSGIPRHHTPLSIPRGGAADGSPPAGTRDITGAQIIPLIQPVLQRMIVELRQSFRFGLPEGGTSRLALHLSGPGSQLPGLANLLREELACEVLDENGQPSAESAEESQPIGRPAGSYDPDQPGSPGSVAMDVIESARDWAGAGLVPPETAVVRRRVRIKRGLWVGAAAAVAVIAFDAMRYEHLLEDARREAQAVSERQADLEALEDTAGRLRHASRVMRDLDQHIEARMGSQLDARAIMQELSRLTPPEVRLTAFSFALSDESDALVHGSLNGFAFAPDDPECEAHGDEAGTGATTGRQSILRDYVGHLQMSPVFREVILGRVQSASMHDRPGQRFETTVLGTASPLRDVLTDAASSGGDLSRQGGDSP